jgi:hypothetical protein
MRVGRHFALQFLPEFLTSHRWRNRRQGLLQRLNE